MTIDIYAKPISLTYKGRERYSTSCGGLISLFVIVFILSLFGYYSSDLISRSNTQIRKSTIVQQSNSYQAPENISGKNLTMAFKVSDFFSQSTKVDPYFGELIMR
jgi:hypothetical protein